MSILNKNGSDLELALVSTNQGVAEDNVEIAHNAVRKIKPQCNCFVI